MSEQNDKLPNAWHAEYLKAPDRAMAMERERDEAQTERARYRADVERMNFSQEEILKERDALRADVADLRGQLADCEEHAQTTERDARLVYEGEINLQRKRVKALEEQLSRICKEGFNDDDTIGGEPADEYVLRQIGKLKAIDEKPHLT